ncbi:MAG: ABC transporter permease subunit [Syntrophomonadaceae bacterium]
MNIYRQELRMLTPSAIYWFLGMLFCLLLFMLIYPPVAADVQGLEAVLANFPLEMRKALGLSSLNLARVLEFYAFIFLYILLIGAVFAMKSGLAVLSEEARSKTADFLLSKPVSRSVIVTAKWGAVLTALLMQSILFILFSYMIVRVYGSFSRSLFLLITFSLIQMQLFFSALGLFLAALVHRMRSVLPLALGIVFGFFLVQIINQSVGEPALGYMTPFAYFDPATIVQNGAYNPTLVIINLSISAVLVIAGYKTYHKKDFAAQ